MIRPILFNIFSKINNISGHGNPNNIFNDINKMQEHVRIMSDDTQTDKHYVGYVRVSTEDQDVALQRDALIKFGVHPDLIFEDKMTGTKMDRPGFNLSLKICRTGSVLVVWKLDRLGRTVRGVLEAVEVLAGRGIAIKSLTEDIDTSNAWGKMIMTVLLALAEMERNLISERTKAGIAAKKARGETVGRKHSIKSHPKRLRLFNYLFMSGELNKLVVRQVLARMNYVDRKAKRINGTQGYYNWRGTKFEGYEPHEDPEYQPPEFDDETLKRFEPTDKAD